MGNKSAITVRGNKSARMMEKIKKIKLALPSNYFKIIETRSGYSERTIREVINTLNHAHPIMGHITKLIEEEKQRRENVKNQLEKI